MRFGSVCSGIEAASVAWKPLGWEAAWLSEIEPFPSAVLAHHYPDVPNLGDMTALPERILSGEVEAPDVFCGGTPCQAFSVAGNRKSLDDARGNLSLTFCEIANAIDTIRQQRGEHPAIIFWENVPGCRSTKDNFFGCFLAELCGATEPLETETGKWPKAGLVVGERRRVAWATLDSQWFGVAQRRQRLFVVAVPDSIVGDSSDRCPSSILSLGRYRYRDTPKNSEPAKGAVAEIARCLDVERVGAITASYGRAYGAPEVDAYGYLPWPDALGRVRARMLTPVECERLQGFPDGYTNVLWRGKPDNSPYGARYKALGNSWAVPVVRWIGERINNAFHRL